MNVKRVVQNQNMIFDILKQSKLNQRLSHAYLFYGDEGVGKNEMAYALACLLYCPNGGCFTCEVCQSIIENQHMNVDYIGIETTKKMISKDQITDLQEEFSKTSLVDGTRVYIVDGIDTASSAAQNSLLKFIEEPVNSTPTIGIFIANEISNVVPTIISRCSLQHFKALPLERSVALLQEEGLEELDAILLANLTNNIDEAIEVSRQGDFVHAKTQFLEFLNITSQKEAVLFYLNYVSFYSNAKNLEALFQWIILFLQDANIVSQTQEGLILKPLYDKIVLYKNKNTGLRKKLSLLLHIFSKLKYNVSAKNVFHELIVKFVE